MTIKEAIGALVAGRSLARDEVSRVFASIMAGEATPAQIGGFLIALRAKGETSEEIAGAAAAMRAKATRIQCPNSDSAVDTCGTGGDGAGTANISTVSAIVTAAAGATVAKHGNRASSSKSGSADVLEVLGVNIVADVATIERCMKEVNIGFLFAPAFHAATKHAAGPRKELGVRTMFNLLGPLTNPAGVKNQVVGVFAKTWCAPVAEALGALGAKRAYVVHGGGGLDEISVQGKTTVAEWNSDKNSVTSFEVSPKDFGLKECDPAGLAGGDAKENAEITHRVLAGEAGAVRNAVVLESSVALVAAGIAKDFKDGAERAQNAIDSGAAATTLTKWVELSQA